VSDDYIYEVKQVARDTDGGLICRCPHCQDIIGIEGEEIDEVQGEQYKCRCGGWLEVAYNAVRVKADRLALNKGIPG
tara:strand:- start:48 stop:278 length:231 start_codon:yes stop_codon:yes gene_type:complete